MLKKIINNSKYDNYQFLEIPPGGYILKIIIYFFNFINYKNKNQNLLNN